MSSYFGKPVYPVAPISPESTIVNINATTTLGAGADTYGKNFVVNDPGSFVITLPAIDPNLKGQSFSVFSACTTESNQIIVNGGGELILHLGSQQTSLILVPGAKILFENNGTNWIASTSSPAYGITPSLFDSSKRLANTEFVQRALGNFSSFEPLYTNKTLTHADMGKIFAIGAAGLIITLPNTTGLAIGSSFTIVSPTRVAIVSPDKIIGVGDGDGTSVWLRGSGTLYWRGDFWQQVEYNRYSLTGTGYTVFPSGLIVQWGNVSGSNNFVGNLPLTFPNNAFLAYATDVGSSRFSYGIAISNSQFTIYGPASSWTANWLALGN